MKNEEKKNRFPYKPDNSNIDYDVVLTIYFIVPSSRGFMNRWIQHMVFNSLFTKIWNLEQTVCRIARHKHCRF